MMAIQEYALLNMATCSSGFINAWTNVVIDSYSEERKKKGGCMHARFLLQFLFLFADIKREDIGREAICAHAMCALFGRRDSGVYKREKNFECGCDNYGAINLR